MAKNKIVAVLVVLLVVVGLAFHFGGEKLGIADIVSPQIEQISNSTTSVVNSVADTEKIQVGTPVGGQMKGVIEVGASGFNAFVVNIDKDKNWELVDKQFGESLAYEGFASEADVKAGLKKYLSTIFNQGVSGRNVHFVISSGALKNPKTELIAKAMEKEGFVVNRASADQEGKLALKASLPKEYQDKGFSVDMGSGNTKVSWYENGKAKTIELVGAKYFQNGVTDAEARKQIQDALAKVPSDKREYCFIIGGVPFTLAKEARQGNERFTFLPSADSYSSGNDVKLKSGLNLYREIENVSNKVVFDWDANFTIGYLLTLN